MNYIKEYWENQGLVYGNSHKASWGDNWAIDLEIETIRKHIKDGDRVLDVGCGNGYSTLRQFELNKTISITGVDFSGNLISSAITTKENNGIGSAVLFETGDIRHLNYPENSFDVVYTTRSLINLTTWEEQKVGITECLRVAKPDGVIVLSEAFWEPLILLNALRILKHLPPLVEHDFNRYLKQSKVEEFLHTLPLIYEFDDFSSIYYLGSRFLRELITDPSCYPEYSNPINKLFYEIEKDFSGGGMGIQQAVIINKNEQKDFLKRK